ncbi:hypothetical protein ACH4LN_18300 [Streptomyces albus]|uniref:hypothetical protein n=1 Tax=Streptomyces albus TaxID=1888 RepID=UPI001969FDAA|nr:hypothetical protein [Streptomyces albus]GHJ21718.1 hypothetical protein TPA0909_33320 [Streptomyces albus]
MTVSVARVMNDSFTVAADGSYAARLTTRPGTERWYPERWTLDGPEPYAVPLPAARSENPAGGVLPLADGRVLVARPAPERCALALLYPSGPDTGEVPLGTVETGRLRLLPPAPCGMRAYALTDGRKGRATEVWRVAGGTVRGPERVARLEGRCSGGAWLDPEGRLLALDVTRPDGAGPVKTVTVDVVTGAVSPLLQITEESNDRLLLADPDSGLLLVRSDAPGEERLGWGVLGSHRPVRFPEVLHPRDARLTPIAVQPGQVLLPERCAVALRVDAPHGTWPAVWRPGLKELRHLAGPPGWLAGKGLWTREGELRVPYSTAQNPCGLARMRVPLPDAADTLPTASGTGSAPDRATVRETAHAADRTTDRNREAGPAQVMGPGPVTGPAQVMDPGPVMGPVTVPGPVSGRMAGPGSAAGRVADPGSAAGRRVADPVPRAGQATDPRPTAGQATDPGPTAFRGADPRPTAGHEAAVPVSASAPASTPPPAPPPPAPTRAPASAPAQVPASAPATPTATATAPPLTPPPPAPAPTTTPPTPTATTAPATPASVRPPVVTSHPATVPWPVGPARPSGVRGRGEGAGGAEEPGGVRFAGRVAGVGGGAHGITALQHHGHGGPATGLLASLVRRSVSAGGGRSLGAGYGPAAKPVPLQEAPLTGGRA